MTDPTSPQSPDLEFVAGRWLESNPPQGEPPHPGWEWSGEWTLDGPLGPDGRRTGRAQGGKWVPPLGRRGQIPGLGLVGRPALAHCVQVIQDLVTDLTSTTPKPSHLTHQEQWERDAQALIEAGEALVGVFDRQPVETWVCMDPTTRAMVQDAISTAERLIEAERLAHDVIQETGGSPEWHAVVSELLDHLTGGYKQKISIPCPPLGESSRADRCAEVSARESGASEALEAPGGDDPTSAEARPRPDRLDGRSLLERDIDGLTRSLAIPYSVEARSNEVLVTADDRENQGALFAWAERVEEQRADLIVDTASWRVTLSGAPTAMFAARATWQAGI